MEIESMVANSALVRAREGESPFLKCFYREMSDFGKQEHLLNPSFLKDYVRRKLLACLTTQLYLLFHPCNFISYCKSPVFNHLIVCLYDLIV